MKKIFLIAFLFLHIFSLSAQNKKITSEDIGWELFLKQHDLVWDTIMPDYYSGAILGNGLLGVNIFADDEKGVYRWNIGRSDVTENRGGTHTLYDEARLPIGYFKLYVQGKILSENMRLSIWDATVNGNLITDKGKIDFKTFVDANNEVIVIETQAQGAEKEIKWAWLPEEAISPRTKFSYTHGAQPVEYTKTPNSPVEIFTNEGINYSIQKLYSGWSYVVAWITQNNNGLQRTFVTVAYEKGVEDAVNEATHTLNDYINKDIIIHENEHKQWWHNYYPASFASFPNAKMESFYWIQQYKFACLTRKNKNIIDLMGPWTTRTPWPAIWWNLNMQLTYSPLFTANRMELSEPLWNAFDKHSQSLIDNVIVEEWKADAAGIGRSSSYNLISPLDSSLAKNNQYEVGNLTWILFYYWQYCTYSGNTEELINKFYPLLKRSIAYYSHILYKKSDGKYHLPLTASPEYKPASDCNYDLALLRWGLYTLLDINKQYKLNDSLKKYWETVLNNLIDYPIDSEQGFMIGDGVKLESSHRHYSHLLMVYPLYLVNWEQVENRELILKSLNHWIGMKGALQGYSYTGSSSIYSMMGNGNLAVKQLEALLNKYIQPNTLYKETGPVIETPLSAATSIQELYLQSWGGIIRVFPAVPDNWNSASFINYRAEGGYFVSALRKNASTVFIQLEAIKSGACTIQAGINIDNIKLQHVNSGKRLKYKVLDKTTGLLQIHLNKYDIIQLIDTSYSGDLSFELRNDFSNGNHYGVKKK